MSRRSTTQGEPVSKWIRARSVRMLGALFGLSLMLSACDVSQLLTLLDGSAPAGNADTTAAGAGEDESPAKPAAEEAAPAEKTSKPATPAKKAVADTPAAKKAEAKPAANSETTPTAAADTGTLSKVEAEIFQTLNATRANQGLKPLALDKGIAAGARAYSCQMAKSGQFKHADLRAAGVSGENIAAGYRSAASVHDGWMNSAGHRKNRMSDRWTSYGVGVCANGGGTPYYTERFR